MAIGKIVDKSMFTIEELAKAFEKVAFVTALNISSNKDDEFENFKRKTENRIKDLYGVKE